MFLRICHVLEFEEIYTAEAKERMRLSKGRGQKGSTAEGLPLGRAVKFMADEAPAGESSVKQVLYIRKHDLKRFNGLKANAEKSA